MAARITNRSDIRILQIFFSLYVVGLGHVAAQNDNFQFTQEPVGYDRKEGESAVLLCSVDDPTNIIFEWTQDGNILNNNTRRHMDDSSLTFRNVDRELDSGVFKCVARNIITGREIVSAGAELNINWISGSGRVQLKKPESESEVTDGVDVTLRCRIEGNPDPDITWYINSTQITASEHIEFQTNKLLIDSASSQDNGVYSCRGENRANRDGVWSSSNITLNVLNPNAPVKVITPRNLFVNKNDPASLDCQMTGNPQPEIKWYLNNEGPIYNRSRLYIFDNGTLHVTSLRSKHEGEYICVGENQFGQTIANASVYIANINELPFLGRKIAIEGDNIEVACKYPGKDDKGGRPTPTREWLDKNLQPVPSSGKIRQVNHTLYIDDIELEEAGDYTCKVSNMAGEYTSAASIIVATVPTITTKPEGTMVKEGGTASFNCEAEGHPNPDIEWRKDNQLVASGLYVDRNDLSNRYEFLSNGSLQIPSVQLIDDGEYTCIATTPAGADTATAYLKVQANLWDGVELVSQHIYLNNKTSQLNVVLHIQKTETLKFYSRPRSKGLNLGQEDRLLCSARGADKPRVWWTKKGTTIIGQWPTHINESSGMLSFNLVQKGDAGEYTCHARNSEGYINVTVTITVVVFPFFTLEPQDTDAYEGYSTILHCQAEGDPHPHISWSAGDKKVLPEKHTIYDNGSLYIEEVGFADEGRYTCIAGSKAGLNSKEVTLHVIRAAPEEMEEKEKANLMMKTVGIAVGCALAYIILVVGLMVYCKNRRRKMLRQASTRKENGEAPKETYKDFNDIKDVPGNKLENEMAMNPMLQSNKRRGSYDRLQFPRHDLQTITMLGRGEFGEVFLAKAIGIRDGEQETVVVVKALMTKDEDLQVEFKRELDMLSKLQHDHVVKLLGMCKEADPQYMITEYLEWGDLKQFLRATRGENGKNSPPPLHLTHKISIINQIALGMEHLSNHRFIHKDLATRNCLVSPSLEVKVSNLSLTKDMYNAEYYEYHQSLIPIRWMPPEAIFEMEYSTKSDVWAYGVFIWEVFSLAEMPFADLADEDVLKGLVSGEISLARPTSCPEELEILMHRCWEDSPKDRPSFSDIALTIGELKVDSEI
ncbi:inactive tyrosine-protein kinase 7-like isoform X2 [Glandiceps talaboti]